jgi:Do/DeqQ family serine protease
MQRFWLLFAQATTLAVAALFVLATFRPEWLPGRPGALRGPAVQLAPAPATVPAAASYADAVRRATPSVVNIFTTKEVRARRHSFLNDPAFRRNFGNPPLMDDARRSSSLGSGVIVSANGYLLTNNHVVEAAEEIEVALADGRKLLAKVVGNDPETDLAVLRVDAENLPAMPFGSSDALRVGDVVLAIGNPFGVGQTVTSGIVSALGRTGLGINTFENFIQTDAAINPGNSGGALVNAAGQLIGINTAIVSGSGGSMGVGFAIPVSNAKMVLEQIVKSGTVTRGWIGAGLDELTPEMAEAMKLGAAQGVLIVEVLAGSPADRGGIKVGDVVTAVNRQAVASPHALLNAVAALQPGSPAKLAVLRQGKPLEAAVTVGRRPKPPQRPE